MLPELQVLQVQALLGQQEPQVRQELQEPQEQQVRQGQLARQDQLELMV